MLNITCPSCKTPAPPGAVFCDQCGFDLRNVQTKSEEPAYPGASSLAGEKDEIICSNCRHANIKGSLFCENCGAQLAQPSPEKIEAPSGPPAISQQSLEEEAQQAEPVSPSPPVEIIASIPGQLFIPALNLSIPIPQGCSVLTIGRADPASDIFPDIDLDPYGGYEAGIGRQHAQLSLQENQIYLEDLDSMNGTSVNKVRLTPRTPHPIQHGDTLRFGKLILTYMKE